MVLRIATLNLKLNHNCWELRKELIADQFAELKPDMWALNEIHIPTGAGRWLERAATERTRVTYTLLQQSKTGEESRNQAEGLLTRHDVIETSSLDYGCHHCVAQVSRFEIEGKSLDVYVTHLIGGHARMLTALGKALGVTRVAARVQDYARQYQVAQLLDWIRRRRDAAFTVVCGDFNATLDERSIQLMSEVFRPTQDQSTAFTPLQETDGLPTHPDWKRFDRCIDYIWINESIKLKASGLCFDKPAMDNPKLWPSDHVGVWADLEFV